MFSLKKIKKIKIINNRNIFTSLFKRNKYDLVVIGGGSGGLACAQEARKFGAKIALIDYVKPTPIGSVWNLGGTCVNVGCIPKKLLHYPSIFMNMNKDMKLFGFNNKIEYNWNEMIDNIQNTIHSLNFSYKSTLRSQNINYINGKAKYKDNHTIIVEKKNGEIEEIITDKSVISTGLRPKYPYYYFIKLEI